MVGGGCCCCCWGLEGCEGAVGGDEDGATGQDVEQQLGAVVGILVHAHVNFLETCHRLIWLMVCPVGFGLLVCSVSFGLLVCLFGMRELEVGGSSDGEEVWGVGHNSFLLKRRE